MSGEVMKEHVTTAYTRGPSKSQLLMSAISDIGKDELQKVLSGADKKGKGDIHRNVCKLDVEEKLKFQEDQKQNGIC